MAERVIRHDSGGVEGIETQGILARIAGESEQRPGESSSLFPMNNARKESGSLSEMPLAPYAF